MSPRALGCAGRGTPRGCVPAWGTRAGTKPPSAHHTICRQASVLGAMRLCPTSRRRLHSSGPCPTNGAFSSRKARLREPAILSTMLSDARTGHPRSDRSARGRRYLHLHKPLNASQTTPMGVGCKWPENAEDWRVRTGRGARYRLPDLRRPSVTPKARTSLKLEIDDRERRAIERSLAERRSRLIEKAGDTTSAPAQRRAGLCELSAIASALRKLRRQNRGA